MNYNECENIYDKWKHLMSGQIFIDSMWEDIIDIEEDAHKSWVCKTSNKTIELSDIDIRHIYFPSLD